MVFLCHSDFSPLFRLLDDYETHRSRPTATSPSPSTPSTKSRRIFTPAFDVRELHDGYYLDGELPGVDSSNIEIEFSDPHTLVIKGQTQRSYQPTTNTKQSQNSSSSPRWRQPTVEDGDEDGNETSHSDTDDTAQQLTAEDTQTQSPPLHYWAAERSVGEFQRTFTFPTHVDQDGVRASLKNGILSVVVPKEAAPKTKKIRIE